jgi:hypothetical protein
VSPAGITIFTTVSAEAEASAALDNFSAPHGREGPAGKRVRSTPIDVELAYVRFYAGWLNRIEAQSPPGATSLWTAPTTTRTTPKPE